MSDDEPNLLSYEPATSRPPAWTGVLLVCFALILAGVSLGMLYGAWLLFAKWPDPVAPLLGVIVLFTGVGIGAVVVSLFAQGVQILIGKSD
ncbi:MAG: hypothetical protein AAGK78_02440 [Planctomycetota bacterium]